MKFRKRKQAEYAKGDMTPMIDMTFQLIAFFMVLINFTDAEQNERIKLPVSELAKPPDRPFERPLTLQLTEKGTVLFSGDEVPIAGLRSSLLRERQIMDRTGQGAADATIIIRGHRAVQIGKVQDLIKLCQDTGFEKFSLRARQDED